MTKAEWLTCTDPRPMLNVLCGKVSERKLRLFAVACCRRMWHLLSDKRSRSALERSELLADQQTTTPSEWQSVKLEAWSAEYELHGGSDFQRDRAASVVKDAVTYPKSGIDFLILASFISVETAETLAGGRFGSAFAAERATQTGLVRCVFGNPFCPLVFDSNWLTPTVTNLATAAYEVRDLHSGKLETLRLAVLANAIEEAGCDNEDLIQHCRSEGPHIRGCWALDLILGKS